MHARGHVRAVLLEKGIDGNRTQRVPLVFVGALAFGPCAECNGSTTCVVGIAIRDERNRPVLGRRAARPLREQQLPRDGLVGCVGGCCLLDMRAAVKNE